MALPRGTTGSLDPTFVPARLVGLTVKPASALALHSGFPIRLSRSPRQSLYHSTIRAGRNLPDKEFRYLRLIVNLHVAMQYGLYLLRQLPGVRRVVSEDSANHFLQGSLSDLAFRNRV